MSREGAEPLPLPAVSAVVATRDRPELLRRAVRSIVACRYQGPLEVVVVFDQSDPDPELAELGTDDRAVRVIANTRSAGLPGARNSGIGAAAGELVAFCDDDDSWLPAKLEAQVPALLAAPGAEAAVTGIFVRFQGTTTARVLDGDRLTHTDLLRDRHTEAHPSTFLVRRSALQEAGLVDEELPGGYAEDYDLLLRLAARHDLVVVGIPLTVVHWSQASFFFERWATIDDALGHLLEKHPDFGTDPVGLARIEGQRAMARAAMGRGADARRAAWDTLRLDWRQPRGWLALAASAGVVQPDALLRFLQSRGRGI